MARMSSRPSTRPKARGFSLGVSVGSTNHAGNVLEDIIEWINESTFEFGIIDLSDTLNRYGLMLDGAAEDSARATARKQGDQWLDDHRATLRNLQKPVKIIRWDEWLNDPRFAATLKEIQIAIDTNSALKTALYMDISNFYVRKGYECTPENARLSMQYFAEEMAVHSLLHSDYDVTTIYPGKQLEAYKLVRSGAAPGFPAGIARSSYMRLIPHNLNTVQYDSSEDGVRRVATGS